MGFTQLVVKQRYKLLLGIIILLVFHFRLQAQEIPIFEWYRPQDTVTYTKALRLFDANEYELTLKELKRIPSKYSAKDAAIQRLRGLCYFNLERYDEAVKSFTQSIILSPNSIFTYYNRGNAFLMLEDYDLAAKDFISYTNIDHKSVDGFVLAAYSLSMQGKNDEAINLLEKFEGRDTTIYLELATQYADAKNDYLKAIESLEEALTLAPNFLEGLEALSICYYQTDQPQKALELIARLIELQPNYGRAHFLQGVYYLELGLEADSERSFTIAREKGYTWDEEEYEFDNDY